MNREEIIRMAREARIEQDGEMLYSFRNSDKDQDVHIDDLERFAALVAAAEREKVAAWMIQRSYATGHGDTTEDLLKELDWQIDERIAAEREACAKVCEEKQEYSMPIPCPDGISGCLVAHYIPARREKTGSECAAAIRARGQA